MDFIDFEASEDTTYNKPLVISDEEEEINNDQMEDSLMIQTSKGKM